MTFVPVKSPMAIDRLTPRIIIQGVPDTRLDDILACLKDLKFEPEKEPSRLEGHYDLVFPKRSLIEISLSDLQGGNKQDLLRKFLYTNCGTHSGRHFYGPKEGIGVEIEVPWLEIRSYVVGETLQAATREQGRFLKPWEIQYKYMAKRPATRKQIEEETGHKLDVKMFPKGMLRHAGPPGHRYFYVVPIHEKLAKEMTTEELANYNLQHLRTAQIESSSALVADGGKKKYSQGKLDNF